MQNVYWQMAGLEQAAGSCDTDRMAHSVTQGAQIKDSTVYSLRRYRRREAAQRRVLRKMRWQRRPRTGARTLILGILRLLLLGWGNAP